MTRPITKRLRTVGLGVLLVGFLAALPLVSNSSPKVQAAPATFTVTNTNDTGAGSLRAAIEAANANGNPGDQDTISFDINSDVPATYNIKPASSYTITQSVLIDGYTQSDATMNTAAFPEPLNGLIRIELEFSGAGLIDVTAPNVTIQGLAIGHTYSDMISDGVIRAYEADNFELFGMYIGTDAIGNTWSASEDGDNNQTAVEIVNSNNVSIGSFAPGHRNVIGTCDGVCVGARTEGVGVVDNLLIQGNNLGVAADSIMSLQSQYTMGIKLEEGVVNAQIGGSGEGEGNFIANMTDGALWADRSDGLGMYGNLIFNNRPVLDNVTNAVFIAGSVNTTVGSTAAGAKNRFGGGLNGSLQFANSTVDNSPSQDGLVSGNTFGYNYDESAIFADFTDNIIVSGDTQAISFQDNVIHNGGNNPNVSNSQGISIRDNAQDISAVRNSIFNNSALAIDLGNNGNTDNDELDADTGPNGLLNHPGYVDIVENAGNTEVTYTLDVPAGDYRIEFFSSSQLPQISNSGQAQTYLDFDNITSDGTGLQEFSIVITGTGYDNLGLTATEIDGSTSSGFGATSEIGTVGEEITSNASGSDIAAFSVLSNPQDFALGAELTYNITVSNYGPDALDLSTMNSLSPGQDNYFLVILPPQLSYLSFGGPNLNCSELGNSSLFGPAFSNHTNHTVVSCAYTGSGTLAAGASVTYSISATVDDDSDPGMLTHVFLSAAKNDPDLSTVADISGNGGDIIDGFTSSVVNNYARASAQPVDLTITKTLDNPEDVAPGATLFYTLTISNNGTGTADISGLDLSGVNPLITALIMDLMPPNLTYIGQDSNAQIACNWLGANSANGTGGILADHADYSILLCAHGAGVNSLAPGESISTTIETTTSTVPETFTNEAFASPLTTDPNYLQVADGFSKTFTGGGDLFTLLGNRLPSNNNFVLAAHTTGGGSSSGNNGGGANGGSSGQQSGGGLTQTGQRVLIAAPLIILVISSAAIYIVRRRSRGKVGY